MLALRRPRHVLVNNFKIDLRGIGCDGMDWIELAQKRDQRKALVSMVMNLKVPLNVGKFSSSCMGVVFSRRVLY
jgi:hypothetical protein